MQILTNYSGSSIEILENNEDKNIANLSLKKENDSYSHYYNFKVENLQKKEGKILINNISKSKYYDKSCITRPYIKRENEDWKIIEERKIRIDDDKIEIIVDEYEKLEISLVPRYVLENLKKFIKELELKPNNLYINIEENDIPTLFFDFHQQETIIILGRQHPGETLSSFFIEGIVKSIVENEKDLCKYNYLFFPIVNIKGVQQGNHRYTNGVDFNRSWNKKDSPKEIKEIKEELKKYKIRYFIDIHNDEISSKDYIRKSKKTQLLSNIGITVLNDMSKIRRFARAIIKNHKVINLKELTAREYVESKYKCDNILIELSMQENYKEIRKKGYRFIINLVGERE